MAGRGGPDASVSLTGTSTQLDRAARPPSVPLDLRRHVEAVDADGTVGTGAGRRHGGVA